MEKSKSFPQYSSSHCSEFGFQDRSSSSSSSNDNNNSYTFNGPNNNKGDQGFSASSDPELKRKKRIAAYNMFTTEGKLKASMRDSFKWIKAKFTDVRYGF